MRYFSKIEGPFYLTKTEKRYQETGEELPEVSMCPLGSVL